MRIIGGKYKHKRIDVPRTFKARPTTDFAKESLFNILTNVYVDFDESLTALDLFGGTGSIGIEFVSRGCSNVVSVEKDYKHYQFLIKTARELNDSAWKPVHADVFKFIQRCPTKFNIVFADPPYALNNIAGIPDLIFENELLEEGGLLILEHGKDNDFSTHPYLIDHRTYGSVNFSFFRKP
jgi:16S rRNA (guanine(966)-N(2))-methyltransferase RsmD